MGHGTKQRMIEAAADLLQVGGLSAASFTDVLDASGAARGAIYHHFPGGKAELARDAVGWTGQRIRRNLAQIEAQEPTEFVAAFLQIVRPVMERAAAGRSCAVAVVTVEYGQRDAELTAAAHDALQSWVDELSTGLIGLGVDEPVARRTGAFMIIFLEGAQVLCRATGSVAPFEQAAAAIRAAVPALLADPTPVQLD